MDYNNLPAGRELDALVAERVMGWHKVRLSAREYGGVDGPHDWWISVEGTREEPLEFVNGWDTNYDVDAWSPSTNIVAAWKIIEKLAEYFPLILRMSAVRLGELGLLDSDDCYLVLLRKNGREYEATAPTAPLAICRSALIACKEKESR